MSRDDSREFAAFLAELRRGRSGDLHASRCDVVHRANREVAAMRARLAVLQAAQDEAERRAPSLFGLVDEGGDVRGA